LRVSTNGKSEIQEFSLLLSSFPPIGGCLVIEISLSQSQDLVDLRFHAGVLLALLWFRAICRCDPTLQDQKHEAARRSNRCLRPAGRRLHTPVRIKKVKLPSLQPRGTQGLVPTLVLTGSVHRYRDSTTMGDFAGACVKKDSPFLRGTWFYFSSALTP